jgi:hypothetical protein
MRFYWQQKHSKDVRFGASLRGLVYNEHHPKKCLILTVEADEYMDSHGMGEYIAYKTSIREQLTPKGTIDVVKEYDTKPEAV